MNYGNYAPFYRPGYFNPMQMQMPPMTQMQNAPNVPQEAQNQFAPQYQPAPQAQMQTPMQSTAQPSSDMIWVQGEAGAKAYLVAPNNSVTLWDSEAPTIYVKSADMNGMPSMRILDFTERSTNAPKTPQEHVCTCGKDFVKVETFNALEAKFDALSAKFETLSAKQTAKTAKTTKTEEE